MPDLKSNPTAIKIGDVDYRLDFSRFPYFQAFARFQSQAQPGAELVHPPIPFFDVALRGMQDGYRHCFRAMPVDCEQLQLLCQTLSVLGVFSNDHGLDIVEELNTGILDYVLRICDKSMARDAAFKLFYHLLLGDFSEESKVKDKVCNAVSIVIKYQPEVFSMKAKRMVCAAYERRYVRTITERAALYEWEKDGNQSSSLDKDEVTTDEEEIPSLPTKNKWQTKRRRNSPNPENKKKLRNNRGEGALVPKKEP
ncbi:uncharacterized protein EV422DRAFT_189490 [Fimicolochytrium jonesii]|uniref:uncharacterized protein n=1 Tax=Fimicolochytrium jonesii TaxID=1396493 RepID=UPI0022FEF14F|nr:uncharacterized protein EV422DRAFT_189490 [Fimicolochytrium jonesii]KAI8818095.1 hypothetical protein EV422DRAFT_189490 [Fimicolochytrium jonesii]